MPENVKKQLENRDQAYKKTGRERGLLLAYHDIAATLFSGDKSDNLEEQFLAAARDGDYDKVQHFLQRRTNEFVNIDGKDKGTGNSALIWAVKRGHLRIVQLLLKHGADVTLRNYDSKTAVELASPAIRQVLLESVERSGCTHRHLLQAGWQGNFEVVRKLLETKTLDINCRNADGFSPIHLVVRDCHLFEKLSAQLKKNYNPCSVLKELLEYRADVHANDDDGKTPIHYASMSKCNLSNHLVTILLNDGSSHNARDRRCYTPIHCASQSGNIEVVKTLIDGGSDVNSRAYAGYTPLHVTAIHGHEKVAISLLNHGADVTLVDDSGLTPVEVAKNKKVKTTLREAWVEATQQKVEKVVLKPVRPPTRESSRMSFDEAMWQDCSSPRCDRKGEVIFEGMDSSQFPSQKNGSPSATRRPSVGQRQMTNAEKANKAEEKMLREKENGRFTPASLSKSQGLLTFPQPGTQSANPPKTPDRNLAPIRPKTKSTAKRQSSLPGGVIGGEDREEPTTPIPLPRISSRKSYPDITQPPKQGQEYPIPITVVSFDPEGQNGQFLEKRHQPDINPSGNDLSPSMDDCIFKGRSSSKTYIEDLEDASVFSPPPRLMPLTPSSSDRGRVNIPDTITESDQSYREGKVFTFDTAKLSTEPPIRMATASRGQNVPSSTFVTKQASMDESSGSSVKLACNDAKELVRGKSIYKDRFNIEDSRLPKNAEISPDTSTSFSSLSSPSSHSEGNKSDTGGRRSSKKDEKTKPQGGAVKSSAGANVQRKDSEGSAMAKLRQAAKDNAAHPQESNKCSPDLGVNEKKVDKITVHSDLLGKVYEEAGTQVERGKTVGASNGRGSGKSESTSSTKVTVINIGESKNTKKSQSDILSSKTSGQVKECATKLDQNSSGAKPKETQTVLPNSVASQKTETRSSESVVSSQAKAVDSARNPKTVQTDKKSATEPVRAGGNINSVEKKTSPRSNPPVSSSSNTPKQAPIRKTSKGAVVVISRANTNTNVNEAKAVPSKQTQEQKTLASAPVKTPGTAVNKPDSSDKALEKTAGREKSNERKTVVVIKRASTKDDLSAKNSKISPRSKSDNPRQTDAKQAVVSKPDSKTADIVNKTGSNDKSVSKETELKSSGNKTDVPASSNTKKTPPPRPSQPPSITPHYAVVQPKPQVGQKETRPAGQNNNGKSTPGPSPSMKQSPATLNKPQTEKSIVGQSSQGKVPQPSKSLATPAQAKAVTVVPQPAKSQAEPSVSRAKNTVLVTNKNSVDSTSRLSKIKSAANKSLVVSKSVDGDVVLAPRASEMLREVSKAVASRLERAIVNNGPDSTSKAKEGLKSPSKSAVGEDQATRLPTAVAVVGSEDMKSPSKSSLNSSQNNGNKSVSIVVRNEKDKAPSVGDENKPEAVVKVTITQSEEKKPLEQTPYIRDVFEHFQNPFINKETSKLSAKREPSKVSRGTSKVGTSRLPSATNKPGRSARGGRNDTKSAGKKTKSDLSVRGVGTPGNSQGQKGQSQPRSGKGKRKGRKKKKKDERPELGERDLTKTAFISGIGWHVAADCNENLDVEAVGMVDSDSDSDIDKSESPTTAVDGNSNFLKVDVDDDIDEPSSFEELVQDEVHFDSADTDSSKFSSFGSGSDKVEHPALAKTIRAIEEFNAKVNDDELDKMLGDNKTSSGVAESQNVIDNDRQRNSSVPMVKACVSRTEGLQEPTKEQAIENQVSEENEKKGTGSKEGRDELSCEKTERLSSAERKEKKFGRSYSVRVKGTDRPRSSERPLKRSNTLAGKERKHLEREVMESKDINSIIDEILTITSDHSTLNDSITNSLRRKNSLTRLAKEAETKQEEVGHLTHLNKVGVNPEEVVKRLENVKKDGHDYDDRSSLHDDYITLPEMLKIFHANNAAEMEEKMNVLSQEQGDERHVNPVLPDVVVEVPSTTTPKHSRKPSKQELENLHVFNKSMEEKPPIPDRPKSSAGKSPRSIKPRKQKRVYQEMKSREMYNSKESLASGSTFLASEFGSDQFSLPCSEGSTLTEEDHELVDSRTIRSQLGRRSAASQAGSTCTNDSVHSEDVICWKKGNMLGRGAYGTVWCGLTDSGGLIAVKQIEMNTVDMEKAEREYEKIQEEVDMLKVLRHKNIVGFYGTSLEDHTVQIFMEYVPGGSIANLLARFGAFEEAVFSIYTKQVLEGVEYIHSKGVIHRDIKGGNVMLTQDGIIKLIDFGCAKRLCMNSSLSQGQLLKSMRGTPYWMAPEVVAETGHGKRSDIWSVGCTVFEMATRKPPWADMNPMAAIFAIGSDRPVPQLDNSFTPHARQFVNCCLQRKVEDRLQASELLLHPFIANSSKRIKRRNTTSAHGSSAIWSNQR
ncbi:uncharacterized protein LOC135492185 [Lineus longissimus]|uniref:uncharacterized protein LOC135492185 n=1 Tax=Lineus longissimus TaxID=88925 RepID=UPI002B4CCFA0